MDLSVSAKRIHMIDADSLSGGADLMARNHQLAVNHRTRPSEFPCFRKFEILKSTNADCIYSLY